jgi:hypothetical protein
MQKDLLMSLHREISDRLFMSGAASRIVDAKPPDSGSKVDVGGGRSAR